MNILMDKSRILVAYIKGQKDADLRTGASKN